MYIYIYWFKLLHKHIETYFTFVMPWRLKSCFHWHRPRHVSPRDIQQGYLGDCCLVDLNCEMLGMHIPSCLYRYNVMQFIIINIY